MDEHDIEWISEVYLLRKWREKAELAVDDAYDRNNGYFKDSSFLWMPGCLNE